ncbi:hypothetical protein, partial [Pseudomonas viridiflava]|uniref:hypothetical protein n=1 Tax=Pseudomonas viridiflava TaxID=33069 RepID=UPI001966E40B
VRLSDTHDVLFTDVTADMTAGLTGMESNVSSSISLNILKQSAAPAANITLTSRYPIVGYVY